MSYNPLLHQKWKQHPQYNAIKHQLISNTNTKRITHKHAQPHSKPQTTYNNNDKRLLYTLTQLGVEFLYKNFQQNMITFNDLLLLSKDDLDELSLPCGPKTRILTFAEAYSKYAKDYSYKELISFFQSNHVNNVPTCLTTNIPDIEIPELSERDVEEHFPVKPVKPIEKNRQQQQQQQQQPTCVNTNKKCLRLCKNNKQHPTIIANKKTNIYQYYQSLSKEVSNYQKEYHSMKLRSVERSIRINNLLSKADKLNKQVILTTTTTPTANTCINKEDSFLNMNDVCDESNLDKEGFESISDILFNNYNN